MARVLCSVVQFKTCSLSDLFTPHYSQCEVGANVRLLLPESNQNCRTQLPFLSQNQIKLAESSETYSFEG